MKSIALTFLTLVLSAPVDPIASSVPIQKRFAYSPAQKMHQLNRVLAKYSSSTKSFGALTNLGDNEWIANVSLADGSVFSMDLDTGSSDTWIIGSYCTTEVGVPESSCDGPQVDASNLGKYSLTHTWRQFYVTYGLGAVAGDVVQGPITLAGATSNIAWGIGEISINNGGSAGLLGLAYQRISSINNGTGLQANWFDGLGYIGNLNRFSFYLSNFADGDFGEVTIGGSNTARYTGTITWVPLNSESYWQFALDKWTYSVKTSSGKTVTGPLGNSTVKGGQDTILDTGTTLMYLATKSGNAINNAIGAYNNDTGGGAYIKCSVAQTGPTVSLIYINLQGNPHSFDIPASVYVLPNGDGTCFSGFQTGGDTLAIFGDVFIRPYYSIFDKDQSRVGFANAVHP